MPKLEGDRWIFVSIVASVAPDHKDSYTADRPPRRPLARLAACGDRSGSRIAGIVVVAVVVGRPIRHSSATCSVLPFLGAWPGLQQRMRDCRPNAVGLTDNVVIAPRAVPYFSLTGEFQCSLLLPHMQWGLCQTISQQAGG